MSSLIAFIVVFGILVFFHELGHFLVAKLMGVGVDTFSLGFGPKLIGKKKGRTEYRIAAIPLGGYVKMVGEEPDAEIAEEDIPLSFTHKSVYKRMAIVAAGPVFNFLLAILIFFVMSLVYGVFILKPTVGDVQEGMPAQKAGIEKGDRIVSIDGGAVETWQDMVEKISMSNGEPLIMVVQRGEKEIPFTVLPKLKVEDMFGAEVKTYLIGIVSGKDGFIKRLNPFEAAWEGVYRTFRMTKLIFVGVSRLITGEESRKNIGGPILVAQMAGHHAERGMPELISFIAFFSITLAVLNLLPIPVLDGGHLMFFAVEAVIGRPVNTRMREIAQQVGFLILLMLMVFAFYNDISRIFTS